MCSCRKNPYPYPYIYIIYPLYISYIPISLYTSYIIHIPPHGRSLEIPRGRGVLRAKILEALYEDKPEFPGGSGGCKTKNLLWGEYGFLLELHKGGNSGMLHGVILKHTYRFFLAFLVVGFKKIPCLFVTLLNMLLPSFRKIKTIWKSNCSHIKAAIGLYTPHYKLSVQLPEKHRAPKKLTCRALYVCQLAYQTIQEGLSNKPVWVHAAVK